MSKIRAILFDLDGVLVDACDWHYHSLNDALEYYEGYRIPYGDHLERFNGLPTSVKLDMLNIPLKRSEKIWQMKQNRTIENIKKFGLVDKYKIRMLSTLSSEGYRLCCVTNSIRKTAIEMLNVTGLIEYFEFVVTNEDVNKNKPNSECYLLAMDKLGISKEFCLIVEDSPKGKEAAYSSGARVLEVTDVYDVTLDNIRKNI